MTGGPQDRLIAWNRELTAAHARLREALRVASASAAAGSDPGPEAYRDLLLYCHGFCVALGSHHVGEDTGLFPELAVMHPELRPTIAKLEQDHSMIASLLGELQHAVESDAPRERLAGHLEGLAAIMESHFRYEEHELLDSLAALELDADPREVLGPL